MNQKNLLMFFLLALGMLALASTVSAGNAVGEVCSVDTDCNSGSCSADGSGDPNSKICDSTCTDHSSSCNSFLSCAYGTSVDCADECASGKMASGECVDCVHVSDCSGNPVCDGSSLKDSQCNAVGRCEIDVVDDCDVTCCNAFDTCSGELPHDYFCDNTNSCVWAPAPFGKCSEGT